MLYRSAHYWTDPKTGETWRALSADNGRDMSMCVMRDYEVERSIAWAKMHSMKITDERKSRSAS